MKGSAAQILHEKSPAFLYGLPQRAAGAHLIENSGSAAVFIKSPALPDFLYQYAILCAACGAQISRPGFVRALRGTAPRWKLYASIDS
nr:hypothetical protein [uncultured Agathobaculum sp.]